VPFGFRARKRHPKTNYGPFHNLLHLQNHPPSRTIKAFKLNGQNGKKWKKMEKK
jgi:hypothetical protein